LLFACPRQVEKIEEATTNQSLLSEPEFNSAENLTVAEEAESSLLFASPRQVEKLEEATTNQSLLSKPDFKQVETEPESSLLLPFRLPAEKIEDSTTNQSLLSKTQFNPVENLSLPPQPESSLEFSSKLSEKAIEDFTIKSSTLADNPDNNSELEDVSDPLERLQRLLLTPELMDSREAIANLTKKMATIEHQIYEPSELINLLLPLITQILTRKISEAREDVARAIAPIVDEMIQAKTQQDKVAVSSALAPVLPDAVAKQVSDYPGEFAKALGPEMGTAIKEQISLERDAMVDALYPVIGSTISKYMAEVVNSINEKVETTLSIEGISRKIRARMQGVSEAELILKEAMPFTIQAIFLIHKGSGLVISEVQELGTERLESEMIAGMLTAIRSFVNDCIAQSGGTSEIDQIEYGQSKIILEVAGYCYMAAVIQGDSPKPFIRKMRNALAIIVQRHGKAIELFDGDPANVPEDVHQILEGITKLSKTSNEEQKRKPPTTLLLIGVGVFGAIFLPWGIYQYRSGINRQIEEKTSLALASDPELAVYRLSVEADGGTLMLSGKLPNQYLRAKAEQIAKSVEPELKLDNAIIAVKVPADPVLTAAEVQRVTAILNQMEGVAIWANYRDGKVTVEGTMLQVADAQKITRAFEQIPGVQSVSNTVQLQDKAIASRIYFELASSQIKSEERSKVTQIQALLDEYPNKRLKLTGHSDRTGLATENQRLALERAKAVRDALVAQGIDSERLDLAGNSNLPSGIEAAQPSWLSRCVEFEIITP
jgi:outer membrane protein OmpA-like peptidoglycan-associated protein